MYKRNNLIYKVAFLYYNDEKTQTEISKILGISRPTVSKMLKEAKDTGIVSITIKNINDEDFNLAEEIKTKYGLKHVSIIESKSNIFENKREVAIKAVAFLEGRLNNYETIGIAWGTTLYEFVNAASHIKSSLKKVIPLIGGVSNNDVKYHSNHLAFKLSNKYQSDVSYFYAPALAENSEVYEALIETDLIQKVMNEGRNVDIAIVSTDYPLENSTFENLGYINDLQKKFLLSRKVIGDVLTSFYDEECNIIENSISDRMIGIGLNDLRYIKETLLVASGESKAKSVKALISKNYISYLFIDSNLANLLI